jgi:hypothetical protein
VRFLTRQAMLHDERLRDIGPIGTIVLAGSIFRM